LVVVGTLLIFFLIFKFGIPFLLFISGNSSQKDVVQTNSKPTFISAPVLNQDFTATNSAQIKITGNANPKQNIRLYVNDQLVDKTSTKDDGSFSFDAVSLKDGDNAIQTKAQVDDKESDFSNTITITYKNKQPSLDVTNPSDGQTFSKDQNQLNVTGKTDPDVRVTVNDFQAIVNSDGNFSYTMQLQNGDNQLKIIAIDAAGNKTEKDLKVTYSQ